MESILVVHESHFIEDLWWLPAVLCPLFTTLSDLYGPRKVFDCSCFEFVLGGNYLNISSRISILTIKCVYSLKSKNVIFVVEILLINTCP